MTANSGGSSGEELIGVFKAFKLQRISRRVPDKQCSLLSGLAFEPDFRGDEKIDACFLKPFAECRPILPIQHQAEMAYRHRIPVNAVARWRGAALRAQMRRDLMAVEVEIDPAAGGASDLAAEQSLEKISGPRQVGNGESQVKGGVFLSWVRPCDGFI